MGSYNTLERVTIEANLEAKCRVRRPMQQRKDNRALVLEISVTNAGRLLRPMFSDAIRSGTSTMEC